MRLFLLRHADPNYSKDNLTEQGQREAQLLAQRLHGEGIGAVYSSPAGRSRATARAFTGDDSATVLPWSIEPEAFRLKAQVADASWGWDLPGDVARNPRAERHAPWDALPPMSDPRWQAAITPITTQCDAWLAEYGLIRDGGSYAIDETRFAPWRLGAIALFAHGGMNQLLLTHLLALPWTTWSNAFFLGTASLTEILFEEMPVGRAAPRALAVGDTGHLRAAGMPFHSLGLPRNTR